MGLVDCNYFNMARKWNNQGGSNFHAFSGKYKKPKDYQNIPSFEDLIESNTTSFNYKIPPKPTPQLGMFGDEIWTYTPIDDTQQKPFQDLTPKDPTIPKILEKIPETSIPKVDPVNKSTDLFPSNVTNEYELVVKYGLLVLRISSGQAYAARQMLNDAKYDFSLVIKSSNAISFAGNAASTVNLISVSNSAQNPIYSLYNWLKTKISIATNNDATGTDPVLSGIGIVENVAQLPSTQFVLNDLTCGLFYAEGIQPDQICLNAINEVFKFEPSKKDDPEWTVTYPGEILPLCLDNMPNKPIVTLSVDITSTYPQSDPVDGVFNVLLSMDRTLTADLIVDLEFNGTTSYTDFTINSNSLSSNQLAVTIPAGQADYQIAIKPNITPAFSVDRTIIPRIIESVRYAIDVQSLTLTITPPPLPIIGFGSGLSASTIGPSVVNNVVTLRFAVSAVLSTTDDVLILADSIFDITTDGVPSDGTITNGSLLFANSGQPRPVGSFFPGSIITRYRSSIVRIYYLETDIDLIEGVDFQYGIRSVDLLPS